MKTELITHNGENKLKKMAKNKVLSTSSYLQAQHGQFKTVFQVAVFHYLSYIS